MPVPKRLVLVLAASFALAGPARADFITAAAEVLADGWVRYTYTLDDPTDWGLESFVLKAAHLDAIRAVTQPEDWMSYVADGRLSWARDVYHTWTDKKKKRRLHDGDEVLVFSFESPALPDLATYRAKGLCLTRSGEVVGPGPELGGNSSTTKTPEPAGMTLLALGGVCWWVGRRVRRRRSG